MIVPRAVATTCGSFLEGDIHTQSLQRAGCASRRPRSTARLIPPDSEIRPSEFAVKYWQTSLEIQNALMLSLDLVFDWRIAAVINACTTVCGTAAAFGACSLLCRH